MRRARLVLLVALVLAAALRRHTQVGDDDGADHSPRPLVKTRRYETPVAPTRQSAPVEAPEPPKVRQVEVGERAESSPKCPAATCSV
jgi:hypothetical protein